LPNRTAAPLFDVYIIVVGHDEILLDCEESLAGTTKEPGIAATMLRAAIAAALGRGESVETPAGTFIMKPPRSTGSRIRTRMAHAEDGQFSRQKFRRLESAPKSRIRFHLNQALPGKDFDDS
jgi:hypothetical protein